MDRRDFMKVSVGTALGAATLVRTPTRAHAMDIEIEQIGDTRYTLGEGPVWNAEEGALYWVDVLQRKIWRHVPSSEDYTSWTLPKPVSSYAFRESGGAVITLADGFYTFDFESGEATLIGDTIETELPTRFNDGKADRQGRFVAGTMHNTISEPAGSLYRLDTDGTVAKLDSEIICSNGPCWSLDNKTLYFTDTMRSMIFRYDYDPDSGAVGPREVFADLRSLGIQSAPDGCTVDAEGYLWTAQCLAGVIARIAPDGSLDRTIEMPVKYVTSVTFGGDSLDTLYVTSLNIPLQGQPPTEANAGGLFAVHGLGFTGVPEPKFAG